MMAVDVSKLDSAWKKDGGYLPTGQRGSSEVGGRREGFKAFLKTGKPIETSVVNVGKDGRVNFSDGRHRFAVLRDMGYKTVYVSVDKSEASRARKAFGE